MWHATAREKNGTRRNRDSILFLATLAVALSGSASGRADEGSASEKPAPSATATKRKDIEQALERLKLMEASRAEAFAAELAALESSVDKHLDQTSTEPEFHVVSVPQGGLLPPGLVEGKERFTLRYAEVQVTRTGRPLVLVLRTSQPMYWKVMPADSVRIEAVLLDGAAEQRITGVAEDTWVVPASVLASESSEWKADCSGRRTAARAGPPTMRAARVARF